MTADRGLAICARVADALAARRVREKTWACGRLEDNRYCLVADGPDWKIGFFERGSFDIRYETADVESAISYFVDWVTEEDKGALRDAGATRAWLERHGLKRP